MTESIPSPKSDSRPARPVLEAIPAQEKDRIALRDRIRAYAAEKHLTPPLTLAEIDAHCAAVLGSHGGRDSWRKYTAVLINNEVWKDRFAGVPFERRLLLLPRCLRLTEECPATFDQWGMLCQGCGKCVIGRLKEEAQKLGYTVLVAEGAAIVMSLMASGKIDAVIGVSCLASLERIFPCMESAAVPGIAIPLLQDGCRDTDVDFEWVWEALHLAGPAATGSGNMERMRMQVESWFEPSSLGTILGQPANQTEQIAHEWLARSGKRWRPFLAVCSYVALNGDGDGEPVGLRKIAMAVECFHKASLIHDDIEDNDALRYGQKTLHEEYGTPIALNVGDFLLGEGYRMIGEVDGEPLRRAQMLQAAAEGHRSLCVGQGQELLWMRRPGPLTVQQVLEIFRRKTAPAFEVALRLGAIYAGAQAQTWEALAKFSDALGIAYQIRDDMEDLSGDGDDVRAMRPSVLMAIGYERADGARREMLREAWERRTSDETQLRQLRAVLAELEVEPVAEAMLREYKARALEALGMLQAVELKLLLRRVVGKIFNDLKVESTL